MTDSLASVIRKFPDLEDEFWPLYELVRPYTMTGPEKLYDLYKSVQYVVRAGIPGSIVECGVWKGGSMMLVAETLKQMRPWSLPSNSSYRRPLALYDTFEGLPVPDADLDLDLNENPAIDRYREKWAYAGLDEVKENMSRTEYQATCDYVAFVKGKTEETLVSAPPTRLFKDMPVAIARLDTDWHASTKIELEVLWPLISPGGILIVDDYGHWQGARKATDGYFADKPVKMTRVDYSCRVIQK